MTSKSVRQKFLFFFKKKGHKIVSSSSLIPTDPSVLLTTAGMQQFKSYFLGEEDPLRDFGSKRTASCQKCFRTSDIDSVGDERHLTFFEMLGNFSLGDYFKKEAIEFALDLLENHYHLPKERIWITVFEGDKEIPKDLEAISIWQKKGIPKERIFQFGKEDNFWGPSGKTGPCGPSSEIHYDLTKKPCQKKNCGPNCECGRFLEIWNLVFMQFFKDENGRYQKLPSPSIDTGMGLERLSLVLQNKNNVFETDLFKPLIEAIRKDQGLALPNLKGERIIADHIKGAVFLIADGIFPSNVERGYVLRRILRRAIRYGKLLNLSKNFLATLAKKVIEIYQDIYPEVKSKENDILTVIQQEKEKFEKTLERGLKEFKLQIAKYKGERLPGKVVFDLFQSYGFPLELTKELAREENIEVDEKGFEENLKKHKEISRTSAKGKFLGGLADYHPQTIKLHTAHHLLLAALQQVLGKRVKQRGSYINRTRLRLDFSFDRKLTSEELKKVEGIVNEKIKEDLNVIPKEMLLKEAMKIGAEMEFGAKYPERVTVYFIQDKKGNVFSKEFCGGPHVKNTSELGHFRIIKEEASAAGIRRIRAILE